MSKYLEHSHYKKIFHLLLLNFCVLISSSSLAETIDKLYARGGPNVAGYVTTSENPNLWIDLESNWPVSSALAVAKAANHDRLAIISGTFSNPPYQCRVGPRHLLRGKLCTEFRNMLVSRETSPDNPNPLLPDTVSQILFLHHSFSPDQFTNVSIPDTTGDPESPTAGFLTQNGEAAALAMTSLIYGDKLTYVTECKWFNINGIPTRQCGWLRDVVTY